MIPKILLVDDDRTLRSMAAHVLASAGYKVTMASSGLEAVAHLDATTFDALITDLVMPDMDGLELIRKIRAEDRSILIIAISGSSTNLTFDYLPHAKVFGADVVLAKPIDPLRLVAEVAGLLERTGAERGSRSRSACPLGSR